MVNTTKRGFEGDELGTKTERQILKFRRLRPNIGTPNFGYIGRGLTNGDSTLQDTNVRLNHCLFPCSKVNTSSVANFES